MVTNTPKPKQPKQLLSAPKDESVNKSKAEPESALPTVMGRPTDFRDDFVPLAQELCDAGATDVDLADLFGVSVRTVNRWKVSYPAFGAAVRKGKDAADERVVDALYHRAMGTEYEKAVPFKVKKITYENGKKATEEEEVKVVMVKEVIPPDTTAMIFWLKNRRAQEWRDVHKHEHGGAGAFDQMDEDQLKEYIDLAAQEVTEIEQALLPAPTPQPKGRKQATKH